VHAARYSLARAYYNERVHQLLELMAVILNLSVFSYLCLNIFSKLIMVVSNWNYLRLFFK